jgi:hypothetical protein
MYIIISGLKSRAFRLPNHQARLTPNIRGGFLIMPNNQPSSEYLAGSSTDYQQALDDFGITELLETLSHFQDADFDAQELHLEPEELDSIAALLINQLTGSLNGKLMSGYLNAHRHGNVDVFSHPITLEFPQSASLPSDFPNSAPKPRFEFGVMVVIVTPGGSEWGVVIGRFYNYAAHRCCWMWHYILWLEQTSLSASWVVAATAWEEDLKAYGEE